MAKKDKITTTDVELALNSKLYEQMEEVCEDLGMTVNEAFEIFARKMVNEQGIPFEVTEKEYPVKESDNHWRQIAEVVAGVGVIAVVTAGAISIVRTAREK